MFATIFQNLQELDKWRAVGFFVEKLQARTKPSADAMQPTCSFFQPAQKGS